MTDDAPSHVTDPAAQARHPESARMTGTELQIARLHVGMSRAELARTLAVREDTVRRWEIGKDPVPFRVRDDLRAIENATDSAVNSLIDSLKEMRSPYVILSGEQGLVGGGSPDLTDYGPGWWRAVVARAARAVPGTRVGTREELAAFGAIRDPE
ncbi:DUF1870 family protein [Antribacter sp. KLBMP9083]|uniref:DUF1870 family protein n=1 Tax=Antribacter soli TaxID=2910976 RepID=A0AA41U8H5_9MICO|nr:DUF1870 family protein [Antribacter soli]MCF4123013.1 DUF1870 family protein [Antribacter soli]